MDNTCDSLAANGSSSSQAMLFFTISIFSPTLIPWIVSGLMGVYPRWGLFHFQPALPFLSISFALALANLKSFSFKTDKFKKDYAQRSNGERTISELTKYGGRQGRYVGTKKTKWQLTMVAIKNNIKATLRFIHKKIKTYQQDELCPKMV